MGKSTPSWGDCEETKAGARRAAGVRWQWTAGRVCGRVGRAGDGDGGGSQSDRKRPLSRPRLPWSGLYWSGDSAQCILPSLQEVTGAKEAYWLEGWERLVSGTAETVVLALWVKGGQDPQQDEERWEPEALEVGGQSVEWAQQRKPALWDCHVQMAGNSAEASGWGQKGTRENVGDDGDRGNPKPPGRDPPGGDGWWPGGLSGEEVVEWFCLALGRRLLYPCKVGWG